MEEEEEDATDSDEAGKAAVWTDVRSSLSLHFPKTAELTFDKGEKER